MKLLLAIAAGGPKAAMLRRNDLLPAGLCTGLSVLFSVPGFFAGLALLRRILA